jgi:hypothetical protein
VIIYSYYGLLRFLGRIPSRRPELPHRQRLDLSPGYPYMDIVLPKGAVLPVYGMWIGEGVE